MIENPTRHKAKEAEFHLQQAKEHYQKDDEFSFFLSAFLSAARSITFYMQKQYGKVSGFPEWYFIEQTKMVADADLKYLNETRVEDVHRKPVHTGATRADACGIDAILVKEGEECPFDTEPIVPEDADEPQHVTLRRYFADRDYIETLAFCSSQLSKLTSLVIECEDKFLNKSN